MGDPVIVQEFEDRYNFGYVENPQLLCKPEFVGFDEGGEVAAVAVLQDIIEVFGLLEAGFEFDDSRVIDVLEQLSFDEGLVLFFLFGKFFLLNFLHGVQGIIPFDEVDGSVGSPADGVAGNFVVVFGGGFFFDLVLRFHLLLFNCRIHNN